MDLKDALMLSTETSGPQTRGESRFLGLFEEAFFLFLRKEDFERIGSLKGTEETPRE
jgi:hypothetical protein